jgi:hypothetical protein
MGHTYVWNIYKELNNNQAINQLNFALVMNPIAGSLC